MQVGSDLDDYLEIQKDKVDDAAEKTRLMEDQTMAFCMMGEENHNGGFETNTKLDEKKPRKGRHHQPVEATVKDRPHYGGGAPTLKTKTRQLMSSRAKTEDNSRGITAA